MSNELERYRAEQAGSYLREMRDVKRKIEAMEAEADELRETAGGLKARDYSKEYVSESPSVNAIPDAVAAIIDLVERNAEYIREYVDMLGECDEALREMGGVDAEVLRYRYLCDWPWERISSRMHYSEQWLYELHNRALAAFYDHMPAYRRDPRQQAI